MKPGSLEVHPPPFPRSCPLGGLYSCKGESASTSQSGRNGAQFRPGPRHRVSGLLATNRSACTVSLCSPPCAGLCRGLTLQCAQRTSAEPGARPLPVLTAGAVMPCRQPEVRGDAETLHEHSLHDASSVARDHSVITKGQETCLSVPQAQKSPDRYLLN